MAWQPQQLATVEVVAPGRAHGSSFTTVCDEAMKIIPSRQIFAWLSREGTIALGLHMGI